MNAFTEIAKKSQTTGFKITPSGPEKPEVSGFQKVVDVLLTGLFVSTGIYTSLNEGTPLWEAIKQKQTFSDIIAEEYPEESPWATKPLGFTIDVLLDFTTYVTFGTGAVAKIGAKAGAKAIAVKFAGKQVAKSENAFKALAGASRVIQKTPVIGKAIEGISPGLKMRNVLNDAVPGLGDQAFNMYRHGKSTMEHSVGLEKKYAVELDKRIANLAKETGVDLTDAREALSEMIELKPGAMTNYPLATPKLTTTQKKFADLPEAQKIATDVKGKLKSYLSKEHEAGIPTAELFDDEVDYLTHVVTNKGLRWLRSPGNATKLNEALQGAGRGTINWSGGASALKPEHASMFARKFREMTTREVNDLFKKAGMKTDFFHVNPALAVEVRGSRSVRAVQNRKMLESLIETAEKAGMKKLSIKEAKNLIGKKPVWMPRSNWTATAGLDIPLKQILKMDELIEVKNLPEGGKVFYTMEPGVAKEFSNLYRTVTSQDEVNTFWKAFDSTQNWWKAWTLAPFPAYHMRNMVSNKWNNFLGGVYDPKVYSQAGKLQWKRRFGKDMTANETEIMEQAERLGVLGKGWYGADLPEDLINSLSNAKWYDRVLPGKQNIIIKKGLAFGTMVENNDRLAHFISKVGKGHSYENAALSTKKYLFDYSELTQFEKKWMKRFFPFYTWTRKNIPLQVEHIFKQPGKYAAIGKAKEAIESGNIGKPNEKYMADWMKRSGPVWFRKDPKTGNDMYLLLGGYIPAADLLRLGDPITEIASMLTPLFKVPAELAIPGGGYNFFFDSPIERIPGEPGEFLRMTRVPGTQQVMRKKYIHVLKSLRLLNEIDKMLPPKTSHKTPAPLTERIVRLASGAKLYPYDEKTAKIYYDLDINKHINQLKQMIGKAARKGQEEDIPIYLEKIRKEIDKLTN